MKRGWRQLAVAALGIVGAGCAAHVDAPRSTVEPPLSKPSFQSHLLRHGVAFAPSPTGKSILVNIPAFELVAFEDGEPVLRSRVIVGAPVTPTPRLQTFATAVRFRPSWRPTPDMLASGEYEPGVRAPGPDNPLGLAALRLEPGLLVYLHDTNRRDLFSQDYRALSHGCVRVERWSLLFAWALGLEASDVLQKARGSRTFDAVTASIPVTLGYFTRFPNDVGGLETFADIYGLERAAQRPSRSRRTAAVCAPLRSGAQSD